MNDPTELLLRSLHAIASRPVCGECCKTLRAIAQKAIDNHDKLCTEQKERERKPEVFTD